MAATEKMPGTDWKRILLLSVLLSLLFCGSFAYLYSTSRPVESKDPLIVTSNVIGRSLPSVNFLDAENKVSSSEFLKDERAIIVVVSSGCSPCSEEVSFLKTVIDDKDPHLKFYGLLVYSEKEDLITRKDKYPFKLLYDESGNFIKELEITRTPIKIFSDHGVIKKVWVGSTTYDPDKVSFVNWITANG